ncbi:hypothetical protein, partial [Parashewanella spongiae]|uniref:hypothetical protein n=1 Tax=Parashewanella spongiae TaxID=342950 RepID=UPI001A9DE16E
CHKILLKLSSHMAVREVLLRAYNDMINCCLTAVSAAQRLRSTSKSTGQILFGFCRCAPKF